MELRFLNNLVEGIKKITSTNEKIEKLKYFYNIDNNLFYKLFDYQLNYNYTFGITSKVLKKRNIINSENYSFFDLLNRLINRELTGYNALDAVNTFIHNNKEYEELIKNFLDKDLKIRVDISTINKVLPKENRIEEFKVSLAEDYNSFKDKINFTNNEWFVSRKLDGFRCICVINKEGKIKFYSRVGKEISILDNLKPLIKQERREIVFDGEITRNKDGQEDFSKIAKEIGKKAYSALLIDKEGYKLTYNIFDCFSLNEFKNNKFEKPFKERYSLLKNIFLENENIKIVEQLPFDPKNILNIPQGWEGFILRDGSILNEIKRDKYLLKIKNFKDAEFIVKKIETDIKPILLNGKWEDLEVLSNVIIEYKGNEVSVGCGFSDEERLKFKENPNLILNHKITINYFEESLDSKTGKYSLRFPIYKGIRDETI